MDEGSRHGMAKVGRQGMAKQGRCRQTQPADDPTGTGLAVKQPADDPTGTGLAAKQAADDPTGTGLAVNSQQTKWPAQAS